MNTFSEHSFLNDSVPLDSLNYTEPVSSVFIYLILVILLIYGIAFILKKSGFFTHQRGANIPVEILTVYGHTMISPKEKIILLKLGNSYQLLYTSEQTTKILKEFTEEEYHQLSTEKSKQPKKEFTLILKDFLRNAKN